MRVTKGMLGLSMLLSAGLPVMAQRTPLPPVTLQEKMPYRNWVAMAQVFSSWHGKLMVATVDAPKKLVACTVKELTASGVTCKGKHGKEIVFEREQIGSVSRPQERAFEWDNLWGIGFGALIGGSAGLGTAVLCGIGGAALIAAAPLALVAAVAGVAVVAATTFLEVDSQPAAVMYEKPVESEDERQAPSLAGIS